MAADPADDRAVDACDTDRAVAQAFVDRLSRVVDDGPCIWRDVAKLLDEKLGANLPLLGSLRVEVANLHACSWPPCGRRAPMPLRARLDDALDMFGGRCPAEFELAR